ncbi:MAG: HD domain-containing protein [Gemmatimonadetes bacterium]|nr:HD domain-containing protein [Gemmatimonadota bacterium]
MRSRVGQRLLALFIACALVPVAVLAIWSHRQVRSALVERAVGRLEVAAKEQAVAVVDRGLGIADLLRALDAAGTTFTGLDSTRQPRTWRSAVWTGPRLTADEERHLAAGRPIVVLDSSAHGMVRFVHAEPGEQARWHWGEVPLARLLGFDAGEDTDPILCVTSTADGRVLQCSAGADQARAAGALAATTPDWLVARRAIFLRYEFASPDLELIALRSRQDVVAAAGDMGSLFGLVAALSMLVVFFTGHQQIRRITAPLDRLTAATARMRDGERAVQVPEQGNDELAALARSFNTMSTAIARQVGAMTALDEVDRAALDAGDRERVSQAALTSVAALAPVREALVIIPAERDSDATTILRAGHPVSHVSMPAAMCPIRSGRSFSSTECGSRMALLGVAGAQELQWVMVPLRHGARVEGVVAVGTMQGVDDASEHAHFIHQVSDRLAMALANRRLVDELDAFSLGTLTAFARAVDANSPWTAGHSERVTNTAVALGAQLGLDPRELDLLRRGGLLHDIGKIGVPAAILDKPGRLTPDEMASMQLHPVIGHDILSPIPAMRDVLPMVRHHHERMDGAGYPDGLAGAAIPVLARVLAVADVYDALASDRPYRPGLTPPEALRVMSGMSGPHLDPTFFKAFLALQAGRVLATPRPAEAPSMMSPLEVGV